MPRKRKRKMGKPVTINEHCIVCNIYTGCAVMCENCLTKKETNEFRQLLAQAEIDSAIIVYERKT